MENKYFTPDITDIRVGYEAEFDLAGFGKEGWQFVKFQGVDKAVRCYHEKGLYRVPYLTKEQIEAEGWDVIGVYPNGATLHKKDKYELMFLEGCRLVITRVWKSFEGEPDEKTHRKDVYNGEGKCINTFRYITKLLGI